MAKELENPDYELAIARLIRMTDFMGGQLHALKFFADAVISTHPDRALLAGVMEHAFQIGLVGIEKTRGTTANSDNGFADMRDHLLKVAKHI